MNQFEIPLLFKEKLNQNQEVNSATMHSLTSLFPWFLDNKLFFFPEFTDHGVDHINTVLATAASIITPEAREIITSVDCGAIIQAILLHDCAMQLSWDGFQSLLTGEYSVKSIFSNKDEKPWPELFRSFMHNAQRWDQEKLLQVFGVIRPVRTPPSSLIDVTEIDRRLVGEFLRIHHARLAHEIALLGVPGPIEEREKWITPLKNSALPIDLIGFIARSHNLSLRSAKDRIQRPRQRIYQGIHATYVMAILRIADYLQIQSKRAHPSLLSIRSLKSTISIQEWKKHAGTTDIHQDGDDTETIGIYTEPSDIGTLFSLKSLFGSMQQELDNTWATLGEVYGGSIELHALAFKGLRVRRIQTNIDNLKEYEKQESPAFIPIELKLKSAGADMFNLLVGPLYDGNASVAIREMIQNAVDACSERRAYDESKKRPTTDSKIVLTLNVSSQKNAFLSVKDNGIGMQLETIQDYFLVAGASFRKSQWWKNQFTTSAGSTTVQRSGRFGVGALATFLAGSQTTVTTRPADDESGFGYQLTYSIDDRFIEAKRIVTDIGTEIRVQIDTEKVLRYFQSQEPQNLPRLHWFGLVSPNMEINLIDPHKSQALPQKFVIPSPKQDLPEGWHFFKPDGYDEVHWSFKRINTASYSSYALFCNGIFIANHWKTSAGLNVSPGSPGIQFEHPTLSIFDSNGNLPLNLARDKMASDTLSFKKELEDSISQYFVRSAITQWEKSKKSPHRTIFPSINVGGLINPYTTHQSVITGIFAKSKYGACLLDSALLAKMAISKILIVPKILGYSRQESLNRYLEEPGTLIIESSAGFSLKGDVESFFRTMLSERSKDRIFLTSLGRKIIGSRLITSNEALAIAQEKGRVPKYFFLDARIEGATNKTSAISLNDCKSGSPLETMAEIINGSGFLAEFFFSESTTPVLDTPISISWAQAGQRTPLLEG